MRNNLPARRAERKLSQVRLAELVGVSRRTIISIEGGRFDPSLPLAFKLSELFGCTIEELFFPAPPPTHNTSKGEST